MSLIRNTFQRVPFIGWMVPILEDEVEKHRKVVGAIGVYMPKKKPVRKEIDPDEVRPGVSPDTSRDEFALRYRNLRIIMVVMLIALMACIVFIGTGDTTQARLISGMAAMVIGMMYLMRAFQAWRARDVWTHWSNPKRVHYYRHFFGKALLDPAELLPISLPPVLVLDEDKPKRKPTAKRTSSSKAKIKQKH